MGVFERKRYVVKKEARRQHSTSMWTVTELMNKIEFKAPCGTTVCVTPEVAKDLIKVTQKVLKEFD